MRHARRRRRSLALVAVLAVLLTACNVGKPGPTYVQAANPTVSKPQSKLWTHDGKWFAAMLAVKPPSSSGSIDADITIHRLDAEGWVSTGVVIDPRATTKVDAVSSGADLWTVAHKFTGTASGVPQTGDNNKTRINRFTYDPLAQTYVPAAGFPKVMNPYDMESISIDVDATGTLWAAWVQAQQVFWQRSVDGGATWSTPTALTDPHASTSTDDIASVVAFGSQVGIMWADQYSPHDGFWFVTTPAGASPVTWSAAEAAYVGPGIGDDHVNLKAVDGTVYAAVKTRVDSGSNPNIVLLQRSTAGVWSARTVWVGSDNMTRPVVQLDVGNDQVLVFATGPGAEGGHGEDGGAIFRKSAPLSGGAFEDGPGKKVMARSKNSVLNDVTGTKQPVSSATGLVMLAADATNMQYWYAQDPLAPPAG